MQLFRVLKKGTHIAGGLDHFVGVTQVRYNASQSVPHIPVMVDEVTQLLRPQDGKVYIDMTFGAGGHTRRLLDSNKAIKVITVDRDPVAYLKAQELAKEVAIKSEKFNLNQTVIPVHGKFSTVMRQIHLSGVPYASVHGVLFDLGASSMQFDDPKRGFSISEDGPLDMRMDTTNASDLTAEDVVNNLSQKSLEKIIKIYGEERRSKKLSNALVDARSLMGRIKTTRELVNIISSVAAPSKDAMGRYAHGGTKLFQALRIFVNNELNELNYALEKVRDFLIPSKVTKLDNGEDLIHEPYGIAVVLTFHSLEDRIVKRQFQSVDLDAPQFPSVTHHDRIQTNVLPGLKEVKDLGCYKNWLPLLKHVDKPSDAEIAANPRSRSAKLRAALRIDEHMDRD